MAVWCWVLASGGKLDRAVLHCSTALALLRGMHRDAVRGPEAAPERRVQSGCIWRGNGILIRALSRWALGTAAVRRSLRFIHNGKPVGHQQGALSAAE